MATTIKEFLVGLGFDVDETQLKKFNGGVTKATKIVTAFGAAATVAAGFVSKFVSNVAKDFNEFSLLSKRVNATSEELMRMGFIASVTGSSVDAVKSSFDGLNRSAGEAALGVGRGATAFRDFGLETKKSNGDLKSTSELMTEVGDLIRDLSTQEQTAILTRLGIDRTLVGALTGDVSKLNEEFDALYGGAGIDANKAAADSEAFVDSVTRLKFAFDSLRKGVALRFMPQIKSSIDILRKFMADNAKKIIDSISPIIDVILRVAQAFVLILSRVAQAAGKIISWFTKINDATNGWAGAILAAVAAWKILNLAFLATPLGRLLALGAAIALLIDDFLVFREGGDALIDWGSTWGKTLAVITAGVIAFTTAMAAAKAVILIVRTAMAALNLVMLLNPIGLVAAAIGALIAAGVLLVKNWEIVKQWFSDFFGWFIDGFKKIGEVVDKAVGGVKQLFGVDDSPEAEAQRDQFAAFTRRGSEIGVGAFNGMIPSPAGGMNQNISQNTTITVQGEGSPEATARAVSSEQSRVNADMTRNMRSPIR